MRRKFATACIEGHASKRAAAAGIGPKNQAILWRPKWRIAQRPAILTRNLPPKKPAQAPNPLKKPRKNAIDCPKNRRPGRRPKRERTMSLFSRRSDFDHQQNQLSQKIAEMRRSGQIWADLTVSNPTRVGLSYPEPMLTALSTKDDLRYNPAPFGSIEARKAVAESLSRKATGKKPARAVDWRRIVLSASTSEAYSWLFKLLSDGGNCGDDVMAPSPSYPLFEHLARLEGLSLRSYRLAYDDAWYVDSGTLTPGPQTRALLAVSPNNPTGHYLHANDFAHLEALGLPIICDEVFAPYALEGAEDEDRIESLLDLNPKCLCFVLGGLSKQVGLPQMKLGWTVVCGPDDLVEEALARLELIADTYLSVSTPVQLALPRFLKEGDVVRTEIAERCARNLAVLKGNLQQTAASVRRTEGGWTAVIELPRIQSEDQWISQLLDLGILVQPGWLYDFEREAFAVVSLLIEPDLFARAVAELKTLITRKVAEI